ncbi:unnamed protein product [Rotaria magnacalcarata]|uniref:Uncharacterized protein n=1 Tax=Rotaria magnacalcarata TaxID=392030 RepID=A0A816Y1Z7_9BILA|nr:unnamed protein product [Rotaria magnacalcarata]
MLKYCKISFNNYLLTESPLNISIDEYSPIEHLIINNEFDIDKLAVLLSYIPQLRRLSFATNDKTYLDPNRWEKLILSYMPYLRIFDIQWEYFPQKNVNTTDIFMIESFRTQFWLERQWFFIFTLESANDDCYRVLFSTNPYRNLSSIILYHIVSLTQLTKLNINVKSFLFTTMIELLYLTLNIHTLSVENVCFDKKELLSIQQTENYSFIFVLN